MIYSFDEDVLCELEKACQAEDKVELYRKVGKLMEEAGEVSAAHLAYDGSPNVSASAVTDDPRGAMIEEVVDVMLMCNDILHKLGATRSEVNELAKKKLAKWNRKIEHMQNLPYTFPPTPDQFIFAIGNYQNADVFIIPKKNLDYDQEYGTDLNRILPECVSIEIMECTFAISNGYTREQVIDEMTKVGFEYSTELEDEL